MSGPMASRVLVSRRFDGLLVGWLAVLVWIVVFVGDRLGVSSVPGLTVVFWVGAVVTAAHFGLSYHLAYRTGAPALRARPFALVVGPAVLVIILGGVAIVSFSAGNHATERVASALVTSVYLMTTWHYVKQVYGVGRVGAAYAGVPLDQWDARVLRYGLYPLWFLGAAQVLVRGTSYGLAGYHVGFSVLPESTFTALRVLAICSIVPVVAVFLRVARRTRRLPPAVLIAPYVAAFLWLGVPTNPALTLLLLAPFHALQYLAIGHRAELAVAPPGRHGIAWWLNIFAGAACGGLLASRWLPEWLDAHVGPDGRGGTLLFGAAFFVFLNLHHYLIDATIWRSKGDLVKAMVRRPAVASEPAGELVAT
jgi:hypothetical protein